MIKEIQLHFNPEDANEIKNILLKLHQNDDNILSVTIYKRTNVAKIVINVENEEDDTEEKQ